MAVYMRARKPGTGKVCPVMERYGRKALAQACSGGEMKVIYIYATAKAKRRLRYPVANMNPRNRGRHTAYMALHSSTRRKVKQAGAYRRYVTPKVVGKRHSGMVERRRIKAERNPQVHKPAGRTACAASRGNSPLRIAVHG